MLDYPAGLLRPDSTPDTSTPQPPSHHEQKQTRQLRADRGREMADGAEWHRARILRTGPGPARRGCTAWTGVRRAEPLHVRVRPGQSVCGGALRAGQCGRPLCAAAPRPPGRRRRRASRAGRPLQSTGQTAAASPQQLRELRGPRTAAAGLWWWRAEVCRWTGLCRWL